MIKDLKTSLEELVDTHIKQKVDTRLKEFSGFNDRPNSEWFSELCFCILTANSKARTAIAIQKELGADGFISCPFDDLVSCIRRNKHRFHNNKAKFIVAAREHINIKEKIQKLTINKGQASAREWLVSNIKGIGYKEASHFLRNVGYFDLAILDRHILNLMAENAVIAEKPKSLTKKIYMDIEAIFREMAGRLSMSCAELDLYMWYMKGGDVLK
ncbi:MAG: N-glycosylase/DNA lyase [Nanoarchaeota archaeon]|nr:N-glycosylase/DNA lyase [Nanoarchaeota archaeon]